MNSLHLRATLGVRGIDLELDVPEGETVAILGPNGAGKSTLLQLVSGVVAPDEGIVRLGEDVLTDTVSNTVVPIHARGVATLSQEALLFPHMDARTNVAFAPRSAGANRVAARAVADTWLDAVGASPWPIAAPASCPAVRLNESPSRALLRPTRACCCSTNPSRRWMWTRHRAFDEYCARCCARAVARP